MTPQATNSRRNLSPKSSPRHAFFGVSPASYWADRRLSCPLWNPSFITYHIRKKGPFVREENCKFPNYACRTSFRWVHGGSVCLTFSLSPMARSGDGKRLGNARPSFSAISRAVRRLYSGFRSSPRTHRCRWLLAGLGGGCPIRFQGSYLPIRKFFEPEHDAARRHANRAFRECRIDVAC